MVLYLRWVPVRYSVRKGRVCSSIWATDIMVYHAIPVPELLKAVCHNSHTAMAKINPCPVLLGLDIFSCSLVTSHFGRVQAQGTELMIPLACTRILICFID